MSNSVSNFIFTNTPSEYTHSSYFIGAYNSDHRVHVVFDTISFPTALCVREAIDGSKGIFIDLTKDQITHLLSLDCPDAFIAYALTLCPCPPETSNVCVPNKTTLPVPSLRESKDVIGSALEVDGGILSIAKRLKQIKEEINLINGTAFQNATLTDAQHYQLLDVEMFIDDFIAPYSYREVIK